MMETKADLKPSGPGWWWVRLPGQDPIPVYVQEYPGNPGDLVVFWPRGGVSEVSWWIPLQGQGLARATWLGRVTAPASTVESVKVGTVPTLEQIFSQVEDEMERAVRKFPTWPTDPLHALAIVQEEMGELQKEVLQFCYEPHKCSPEAITTEAFQLAAMALRFLASLDRYIYRPGDQHKQEI